MGHRLLCVVLGLTLLLPVYGGLDVQILELERRQSTIPNPPKQCSSSCDPVNTILGRPSGCTPAMCCTTTFEDNYFNCLLCVGQAANFMDWALPQSYIDSFILQCLAAGHVLPKKAFPGQENQTLTISSTPFMTTNTQTTVTSPPSTTASQPGTVTNPPGTTQKTVTDQSTPTPSVPGSSGPSGAGSIRPSLLGWTATLLAGMLCVGTLL